MQTLKPVSFHSMLKMIGYHSCVRVYKMKMSVFFFIIFSMDLGLAECMESLNQERCVKTNEFEMAKFRTKQKKPRQIAK